MHYYILYKWDMSWFISATGLNIFSVVSVSSCRNSWFIEEVLTCSDQHVSISHEENTLPTLNTTEEVWLSAALMSKRWLSVCVLCPLQRLDPGGSHQEDSGCLDQHFGQRHPGELSTGFTHVLEHLEFQDEALMELFLKFPPQISSCSGHQL